jgi:DNA replication and repair protein RecF
VEEWLRGALADARGHDARAGTAAIGAHRADMALSDAGTGLPAAMASTGQRKALLVGVVLGHATLLAQARGFAPLLLLDEPAVHLDPDRRRGLFAALAQLPAQVLLTGTDRETFLPLRGIAEGLRTGDDHLTPDPGFASDAADADG